MQKRRRGLQMVCTVRNIGLALALAACALGCRAKPPAETARRSGISKGEDTVLEKVVKTDEEWRALLTPEQYHITREKGTERAFTGEYWENKRKGVYHCVGCDLPLFRSDAKYDSGTGWPSFWEPIGTEAVETRREMLGIGRTEVLCARCGGHLGHVFDDGPAPTGKRYCMNSASLKLKEDEKEGATS